MESRMNDDRLEQAENDSQTIERADEKDPEAPGGRPIAGTDDTTAPLEPQDRTATAPASAWTEANVVHATSPYAPDDVREGETFEQRDPAVLEARAFDAPTREVPLLSVGTVAPSDTLGR